MDASLDFYTQINFLTNKRLGRVPRIPPQPLAAMASFNKEQKERQELVSASLQMLLNLTGGNKGCSSQGNQAFATNSVRYNEWTSRGRCKSYHVNLPLVSFWSVLFSFPPLCWSVFTLAHRRLARGSYMLYS